jgi:hypothetical protein
MIGNITTGQDFQGLFEYLLRVNKDPTIIGGIAAGTTVEILSLEFANCAKQRPSTEKPVKHISIGFAPTDGYVNEDTKNVIAEKIVERLGYIDNQWIAIAHGRDDPEHDWKHDHDHIHIVINAIDLEGQRVNDSFDKTRLEQILRELEIEFDLTQVESSKNRKIKGTTLGQTQKIKREFHEYLTGKRDSFSELPLTIKLQAAIDVASKDRPQFSVFLGRLQHLEIDVRPNITDKSRKRISYRLENLKVRGSQLHNASFPKLLSKRGVNFDENRDLPTIEAITDGQTIPLDPKDKIEWSQINLLDYIPNSLKELLPGVNKIDDNFTNNQYLNPTPYSEKTKDKTNFEIG